MTRPTTAARLSALTLLAALSLAACGDDTAEPDPGRESSTADLTQPGSTLAVGDTATITRDGAGEVLKVTVDEVEEGTSADLADLDRPAADETPYFVRYELEHVSGDSPYLLVSQFLSGWSGDTQLTLVDPTTPVAGCAQKTFEQDAPVGTTVSGCATYVTTGDETLDRVQLSYGDDYDVADGHEVSWTVDAP